MAEPQQPLANTQQQMTSKTPATWLATYHLIDKFIQRGIKIDYIFSRLVEEKCREISQENEFKK